jgi:hypothetical protein
MMDRWHSWYYAPSAFVGAILFRLGWEVGGHIWLKLVH